MVLDRDNESASRDKRRCKGLAGALPLLPPTRLFDEVDNCVGETEPACSRLGGMGGGVLSPEVLLGVSGRCGFGGGLGNSFAILGGNAGEFEAELLF